MNFIRKIYYFFRHQLAFYQISVRPRIAKYIFRRFFFLSGKNNNFYRYPYYNQDFLISILPVDQNSETVGYFVVATSKVQSN